MPYVVPEKVMWAPILAFMFAVIIAATLWPKTVVSDEDKPFMAAPRVTWKGKVINALLTPLDLLRVGWQFQRPIALKRLEERAAAFANMKPGSSKDNAGRSLEDRFVLLFLFSAFSSPLPGPKKREASVQVERDGAPLAHRLQ